MALLNIFDDAAFSAIELSDAISVVPNSYGRLGELNVFPAKPVRTDKVAVESKNGILTILPQTQRGGPATQNKRAKRDLKSFVIPNFALEDTILPDDIQGIRAFGSETELDGVMSFTNDRLSEMSGKHDITEEWLRAGALRGTVLDSDATEILNLFTAFGVSEKEVFFDLSTDATDVGGKCEEVVDHIETNLMGDVMTGVRALCSRAFFKALIKHPKVHDAYLYQQGQTVLRNDMRKGFEFMGITFEVYRGQATDGDGNVRQFIADNDVRFYPEGTSQTFRTYYAPADMMAFVNTPGQRRYASLEPLDHDRGMNVHTQMNPLPICLRPAVLVRGDLAAS